MKHLITLALLASCAVLAQAQYYEVGLSVGASNYAGELTSNGFRASEYHPAVGVFGRYNHSPRLAAKGSVTLAQVSGSDLSSGNASTMSRNLSFKSPVYELGAMAEFNLMPYAIRNRQGSALFVTAGVAGFYFNPRAQFRGNWVDLQPLGTEGQGSAPDADAPYRRVQVAIPFGGGAKVNVTNRFNLGLEVIFRRTFTDYLDDISGAYPDIDALYEADPMAAALSFRTPQYTQRPEANPVGQQRGNSGVKDYYMTLMMTVSFNLTHKEGLDFDPEFDIFKDPPPALSDVQPTWRAPQA